MKYKSYFRMSMIIMLFILLNVAGRMFAKYCQLPVWLDSLGTVLTAYIYGPVCGAIVGCAGNLIIGMANPMSYVYALTNVAIGLIVGIAARHKLFDTLFGTLSISVLITLSSVAISTPLNLVLYSGKTGNLWGDGVIGYLQEHGINHFFSAVTGEFYIDFVDKVLTLFALYLAIRGVRSIRAKKSDRHQEPPPQKAEKLLGFAVILLVASFGIAVEPAYAEAVVATAEAATVADTQSVSNSPLQCLCSNPIQQRQWSALRHGQRHCSDLQRHPVDWHLCRFVPL